MAWNMAIFFQAGLKLTETPAPAFLFCAGIKGVAYHPLQVLYLDFDDLILYSHNFNSLDVLREKNVLRIILEGTVKGTLDIHT